MTRNGQVFRPRLDLLENRAVPATFTVTTTIDELIPGDGKLSLREALTRANTTAGADVVVVPAGLYKIELPLLLGGDFDITDGVTIQGAGAGNSVIDGQQLDRVFDVMGNAPGSIKVVFQGLTIRGGNVTGSGGGIRVGNANVVLRDAAVSANRASLQGGGISNIDLLGTGNVTLLRTSVSRNVAGDSGGGLLVGGGESVLTLKDSTIRRNIATNDGGGLLTTTGMLINSTVSGNTAGAGGGGIRASTVTLTDSTVSGNFATTSGGVSANTVTATNSKVIGNVARVNWGGGIDATTVTLSGSTVSGNSAGESGGGINSTTVTVTNSKISNNTAGAVGGGIDATTVTLTGSTVSGNSASGGGGINADTATLTNSTVGGNTASQDGGGISAFDLALLTRSTVSGNTAGSYGGGIAASSAMLTNSTVSGNRAGTVGGGIRADSGALLNCTIVENTAKTGGGGLFHDPSGIFSVRNSIVALNLVWFAGSGADVSGNFSSQGHNLIGDGTVGTGFTDGVSGDMVGDGVNPIDPKIGPLQNNGGRTKTHALLAGSKAIDAGDNAGGLAVDQRGLPRKKDGNFDGVAVVDIGAFEK
jgi:predicted outer membrane repeat protein